MKWKEVFLKVSWGTGFHHVARQHERVGISLQSLTYSTASCIVKCRPLHALR